MPQRGAGIGEAMEVAFVVDVAAAPGGTYTFGLVQSAVDTMAAPDVLISRTLAAATLVVGHRFMLPVPQQGADKRYLAVRSTLGGTTPTITMTAFLQPHSMASVEPAIHADAITIR